jgi:hypothetical protein
VRELGLLTVRRLLALFGAAVFLRVALLVRAAALLLLAGIARASTVLGTATRPSSDRKSASVASPTPAGKALHAPAL